MHRLAPTVIVHYLSILISSFQPVTIWLKYILVMLANRRTLHIAYICLTHQSNFWTLKRICGAKVKRVTLTRTTNLRVADSGCVARRARQVQCKLIHAPTFRQCDLRCIVAFAHGYTPILGDYRPMCVSVFARKSDGQCAMWPYLVMHSVTDAMARNRRTIALGVRVWRNKIKRLVCFGFYMCSQYHKLNCIQILLWFFKYCF